MAKKTTGKISPGTRIRVKPGISAPELPDVMIEGWTGVVVELSGPKASPKYIIEWDGETQDRMTPFYTAHCEAQGLLASMACLSIDEFDAV